MKDCPQCGLVNPPEAVHCDCGYDFALKVQLAQPWSGPQRFAGFWKRLLAYFVDIIPITLLVALVFAIFFGFGDTFERYLERGPRDVDARREFLEQRNQVRNIALGLYLLYCGLLEASPLRGSLGKWLLGIQVVGSNGERLNFAQAGKRNAAKILSFLVFGLGCLWIAWSPQKRGWHDYLAGCYVIVK